MSCPVAPFPGLVKGSPGHQFSLAMVILFPLFILASTALFYSQRKSSVFLRKRSFRLLLLGALGTMIPYSCFAVYDYVGSENFPCGLNIFFIYVSNPAISYPLVLKMAEYQNAVSYARLRNQFQKSREEGGVSEQTNAIGPDPLKGEISIRTIAGHLRVAFCFSRTKEDHILHAKFARTFGYSLLWFFLTALPFLVVFLIRLGMNPHWASCTGCEIETFDAAFLIGIATFALILSSFANPSFSTRTSKRDALRIVRECMWSWMIGGFFYNLGFILFLADPGDVYKRGVFNYRWFVLFATGSLYYVQTVHQVLISRRIRRQVLLSDSLEQGERFMEVMADKQLREDLERFMDTELSGEVLRFLNAVDMYKANYQREGTLERGKEIIHQYILLGSSSEINISSKIRNELIAAQGRNDYQINLFDKCYNDVKTEFLKDGFTRFLKKLERTQKKTLAIKAKDLSVSQTV